ncbi:MAG: SRPBCC domain-containing protein [Flavobacteriales bacterium]|nr:SRPBCC domain-containing protein [Bacteroidota bacterium]MCB9241504.1 SRPBCC domain-containing protein [Flavobacteriales bacterium]
MSKPSITVEVSVNQPISRVWECWTNPTHIVNWNFAADTWCCPSAENDLQPGGRFSWRMEAKDGSMGFDYCGTYESIDQYERIDKVLDDDRKVTITFEEQGDATHVTETFDIEDVNSADLQRNGWQSILENFRLECERA